MGLKWKQQWRHQVCERVMLPSYGWYVYIYRYMFPYIYCCTYDLCREHIVAVWIKVLCTWYTCIHVSISSLTYSMALTAVCMVFAVHTVFAIHMIAEQLFYAWYIHHMHPYLHCLTCGLCNSSIYSCPVHTVVSYVSSGVGGNRTNLEYTVSTFSRSTLSMY